VRYILLQPELEGDISLVYYTDLKFFGERL